MPKLLDFVKDSEMSHEEVMELIEDYKTFQEAGKPDSNITKESDLKGEMAESDKPESEDDTLEKEIDKILDEDDPGEKQITSGMSADEIKKLVNSEVRSNLKRIIKVVRKAPPQAEEKEENKTVTFNAIDRSPFERVR